MDGLEVVPNPWSLIPMDGYAMKDTDLNRMDLGEVLQMFHGEGCVPTHATLDAEYGCRDVDGILERAFSDNAIVHKGLQNDASMFRSLSETGIDTQPKKTKKKKKAQYQGVVLHPWTEKWEAHLTHDGKQLYLGSYMSEEEAARAHDRAALKFLQAPKLNFPARNYHHFFETDRMLSPQEFITELRRSSPTCGRGMSSFRGVTWRPKSKRWEARIGSGFLGRRYVYLGSFKTAEEAAYTYDLAALICKGKAAITNFPLSKYQKELKELESKPIETRKEMECKLLTRKDVRGIIFGYSNSAPLKGRKAEEEPQTENHPRMQVLGDIDAPIHFERLDQFHHGFPQEFDPIPCQNKNSLVEGMWILEDVWKEKMPSPVETKSKIDRNKSYSLSPKEANAKKQKKKPLAVDTSNLEVRLLKLDGILSRIFTDPAKLNSNRQKSTCC